MLIIVEGNIGAGKSTLTQGLVKALGAKGMFEPVETNPYLKDFYSNPKRWALEMQFWLMARRFEMHEDAIRHISQTGQAVVMDRSLYGDSVFAKKNWIDGNIDDRGYKAYLQHRKLYVDRLLTPHITLYLDVSPENCHRRILEVRKRSCESEIPLNYLQGLEKCYGELLMELEDRGSQILRVDWNHFGSISQVLSRMEAQDRFRIFWRGYANQDSLRTASEEQEMPSLASH